MTQTVLTVRRKLADAATTVRTLEANKSIANVSLLELISEQIARNGETTTGNSNATSNNPSSENQVASAVPINATNLISGTDTGLLTKIARLNQLQASLTSLISSLKDIEPSSIITEVTEDGSISSTITTAEEFESLS